MSLTAPSVTILDDASKTQPLWPSYRQQVELPCARTAYVDSGGQGFPVVLVHGLMGYSFSWRKNIPALQRYFRVVGLDLAGCGHSGALNSGRYGVEAWSQQLEQFLDALGIAKAHLVGTSAGGAVTLAFAARCADRVERIALVAPVTPFSSRVRLLARIYSMTGMPVSVLRILVAQAPQFMPWVIRHRYYADAARITPETIPGYLQALGPETVPLLRQAIMDWKPSRVVPTLRQIKAPILLIWGDQDKIVPAGCVPQILKSLPNASALSMAGAGHLCYEELPEEFNAALINFLVRPPAIP
ncbi:MAG: alpha/beta hydrolase [Acidobacteria bacterium]|nr:alpha/beta hydrolase [Acidobacteriota bacterium]